MNRLKQLSFFSLVLTLIFSSCSMEKRVYMPGYHIECNRLKQDSEKKLTSKCNEWKIEQNGIANIGQKENALISNDSLQGISEENMSVSTDDHTILIIKKEKYNWLKNPKVKTTESVKQIISQTESKHEKTNAISNTDDNPKINGWAVAGFICSLVGFLLFLIIHWPFFLGILGIVFSAIALSKIKKIPAKRISKVFALIGLIFGILDVFLFFLFALIIGFFIASLFMI